MLEKRPSSKCWLPWLVSASALACCSHEGVSPPVQAGVERSAGPANIDFQDMEVGQPPRGFASAMSGDAEPGTWIVQADPASTSAKVLAQTSTDATSSRFPLCVLENFAARDVSVSTRFQARTGEVDRAAGLVFRYRDAANYYVVRANVLEDNVRLYRVVGGQRKQFAGENRTVSADEWHTLRVDASGPRFAVFFDGELLFRDEDDTFTTEGKIGLWTKADSVTWFDDLCYGPVLADSPTLAPAGEGR